MTIFTHLHKKLQYPVYNGLYIYVHREGLNTSIIANECLCKKFCTIGFYLFGLSWKKQAYVFSIWKTSVSATISRSLPH